MTTEEKFNAAVNVIRSLPKNGKVIFQYIFNTYTYSFMFTNFFLHLFLIQLS